MNSPLPARVVLDRVGMGASSLPLEVFDRVGEGIGGKHDLVSGRKILGSFKDHRGPVPSSAYLVEEGGGHSPLPGADHKVIVVDRGRDLWLRQEAGVNIRPVVALALEIVNTSERVLARQYIIDAGATLITVGIARLVEEKTGVVLQDGGRAVPNIKVIETRRQLL